MQIIPSIKLPIIKNGISTDCDLSKITSDKKIIIFGVPGAFTPTCSEKHLPGFIDLSNKFKSQGIDDIYCLSVNDVFVMKEWLSNHDQHNLINGIADGNADFVKIMGLNADYSDNYMGIRSKRFALIAYKNNIVKLFVEKKSQFLLSSADYVLSQL